MTAGLITDGQGPGGPWKQVAKETNDEVWRSWFFTSSMFVVPVRMNSSLWSNRQSNLDVWWSQAFGSCTCCSDTQANRPS